MGLLPAHQGYGATFFVNKLEGTKKGHKKFTVLREIGLIVPGVAGFIPITKLVSGRPTLFVTAAYFHFTLSE